MPVTTSKFRLVFAFKTSLYLFPYASPRPGQLPLCSLVDMSVLEPSMNRVRQHVAFMMGLFHLAYLPGSAGLYLGLRFYSLYGRWHFHCMDLPHLGPIYPDRSSKEGVLAGWLVIVTLHSAW